MDFISAVHVAKCLQYHINLMELWVTQSYIVTVSLSLMHELHPTSQHFLNSYRSWSVKGEIIFDVHHHQAYVLVNKN